MIRRIRFVLQAHANLKAARADAAAELAAHRARIAAHAADLDHSAEVLRGTLLKAYRDRDELGPTPTLDAVIADAELALLALAADPPADRKDPNAPRQE